MGVLDHVAGVLNLTEGPPKVDHKAPVLVVDGSVSAEVDGRARLCEVLQHHGSGETQARHDRAHEDDLPGSLAAHEHRPKVAHQRRPIAHQQEHAREPEHSEPARVLIDRQRQEREQGQEIEGERQDPPGRWPHQTVVGALVPRVVILVPIAA